MDTTELDLRTPLQKKKDERNEKIHQEYKKILENPPKKSTKWAIWRAIGAKYGLKAQGVRVIISKKQDLLE